MSVANKEIGKSTREDFRGRILTMFPTEGALRSYGLRGNGLAWGRDDLSTAFALDYEIVQGRSALIRRLAMRQTARESASRGKPSRNARADHGAMLPWCSCSNKVRGG